MRHPNRYIALAALSAALASLIATAAGPSLQQRAQSVERNSPDLMPNAEQRRLSLRASQTRPGGNATVSSTAVTVEQVGDIDSFGRAVKWLGVTQANVFLQDDCSGFPAGVPGCVELNPAPAGTTFSFNDLARIELPAKATNSLLCYWLSPFLTVQYGNPTASPATARLTYFPTLTIENPLLDDPALINPMTGAPFGGSLETSMTSSERFEVLLDPGQTLFERTRDSTVCIAGFISERALEDNFGLTDAQAKAFFKQPMTVRMNFSGSAQFVQFAQLGFGFRIVGD